MNAETVLSPASVLRRLAAFTCLFAFLAQATGIVPCLLTGAAYLEGSHGVRVHCEDGVFELILTHDKIPVPRAPVATGRSCMHHHGVAARMLCLLSQSADTDPDHVLQFANGLISERPTRVLVLKANAAGSKTVSPSIAATALNPCLKLEVAPASLPVDNRPPSSLLLQSHLRSVCLVI